MAHGKQKKRNYPTPVSNDVFIEVWQSSDSLEAVCKKLSIDKAHAKRKVRYIRNSLKLNLKTMPTGRLSNDQLKEKYAHLALA